MKKTNKILALAAVGIISIATIAGCSTGTSSTDSTKGYSLIEGTDIGTYASAASDNPLKDLEYVVQIDVYKVSPDEYRYLYENTKARYTYYMGDDAFESDTSLIPYIKEETLSTAQYNVAAFQMAEEEGITLDSSDLEKMNTELEQTIEQIGGVEAYQAALADSNLTEDLYHYVVKIGYLKEKIYTELFTGTGKYAVDEDTLMTLSENYLRAKHILITPEDTESDESWAAAEAKAKEVYDLAIAGNDFDALITEYGQDPGMSSNPDGYVFTDGDMVTEFYEGTLNLEDNGISAPIKSSYGYHIILRLPIEKDYVVNNSDVFAGDIILENYYAALDNYIGSQTVLFADGYDDITIDTFVVATEEETGTNE